MPAGDDGRDTDSPFGDPWRVIDANIIRSDVNALRPNRVVRTQAKRGTCIHAVASRFKKNERNPLFPSYRKAAKGEFAVRHITEQS